MSAFLSPDPFGEYPSLSILDGREETPGEILWGAKRVLFKPLIQAGFRMSWQKECGGHTSSQPDSGQEDPVAGHPFPLDPIKDPQPV